MDDDYLQPQKVAAWCKARKLPVIDHALQRELVRIAQATVQAIYDDDKEIPRDVRVYYQALKFVAAVAGAPEGRGWFGTPNDPETALSAEQLKVASELDAKVLRLVRSGGDHVRLLGRMSEKDMANLKWLLEYTGKAGLDELCRRFEGFVHYVHILEAVAGGIASGEIEVPAA
jgi:hypothetical protein